MADADRYRVREIGGGVFELTRYYGFMEDPDVPAALLSAREHGLPFDDRDVTFFP